jgi:hypothetical protein
VEHNAGVDVVRVKARWSDEEVALLVQVLRLTLAGPTRNMNQFLHAKFPQRTLEGIKGRRKNPDTKLQVTCGVDSTQLRSSLVEERVLSGGNVESIGVGDELGFVLREAIRSLDGERRWGAATLKRAIEAFLEGDTDENHLLAWLQLVCPSRTIPGVSRANPPNSRERRRRYYARTQKVWKKNRSAAVKEILNLIEESASRRCGRRDDNNMGGNPRCKWRPSGKHHREGDDRIGRAVGANNEGRGGGIRIEG